ncbi:hypothetical protein, partial, partial [Absidia glauca]
LENVDKWTWKTWANGLGKRGQMDLENVENELGKRGAFA